MTDNSIYPKEFEDTLLERFKHFKTGVASVSYKFDVGELKLIPLGDIHLGAPTCNVKKLLSTLKYIKESGSKVILMGDLTESASMHSVGAGWVEQQIDPQEQLDYLYELLEPIKDQILVLLQGNHEFRIWKHSGIDIAKILAKMLGVPYGGYSCFVRIKVQQFNYVIHAQHGCSSAWYPHTKIKAAMRTAEHVDADIFLYGHTHELASTTLTKEGYDLRSRTVIPKKIYIILTGSFLEYHGSYAEKKNMFPVKTGVAKIKLFGDRWDIHIST